MNYKTNPMGIFDRFRKKPSDSVPPKTPDPSPKLEPSPDFEALHTYREYIVAFMTMQAQGNFSPISAYQNPDGSLTGYLFVVKDPSMNLSVEESLERMETEFEQRMAAGKIISYALFYHSQYEPGGSHAVARNEDELKAISIKYKFKGGPVRYNAVKYSYADGSLSIQGLEGVTWEENHEILQTQLEPGKNYFEERVELAPEIVENEHGIKIQQVTQGHMADTWSGIFGFENYRNGKDGNYLLEVFGLLLSRPAIRQHGPVAVFEEQYGSITYRALSLHGKAKTILPVVQSSACIPCTIKTVQEWAHVDSLEAIVTASGRDTFGLWFYATDYAEKAELYKSQKRLDICLSGVVYVLDIYENNRSGDSGLQFSDDFTAYMPNNQTEDPSCFDFVGAVIEVKKTAYSDRPAEEGYLVTTRLITQSEDPNFFTIPLFVNRENMRFDRIEAGMQVTGMFQLQGQIAG